MITEAQYNAIILCFFLVQIVANKFLTELENSEGVCTKICEYAGDKNCETNIALSYSERQKR